MLLIARTSPISSYRCWSGATDSPHPSGEAAAAAPFPRRFPFKPRSKRPAASPRPPRLSARPPSPHPAAQPPVRESQLLPRRRAASELRFPRRNLPVFPAGSDPSGSRPVPARLAALRAFASGLAPDGARLRGPPRLFSRSARRSLPPRGPRPLARPGGQRRARLCLPPLGACQPPPAFLCSSDETRRGSRGAGGRRRGRGTRAAEPRVLGAAGRLRHLPGVRPAKLPGADERQPALAARPQLAAALPQPGQAESLQPHFGSALRLRHGEFGERGGKRLPPGWALPVGPRCPCLAGTSREESR